MKDLPIRRMSFLAALLTLAAACGDGAASDGPPSETTDLTASLLDAAPEVQQQARTPGGGELDFTTLGYDSGSPDAPIQVVEFSDFGCGYCARFHEEVFPTLERDYIDAGKVEWKYVPMILGIFGANAELAARAGECAGEQDGFPAMRDRLFGSQAEWKRADDPQTHFDRYAREQNLDLERFGRCVDEDWRAERIATGTQLSRQSGVRGTPTFFVVGYGSIPGMLPLEVFREVLDTVYADRTAGGAGR